MRSIARSETASIRSDFDPRIRSAFAAARAFVTPYAASGLDEYLPGACARAPTSSTTRILRGRKRRASGCARAIRLCTRLSRRSSLQVNPKRRRRRRRAVRLRPMKGHLPLRSDGGFTHVSQTENQRGAALATVATAPPPALQITRRSERSYQGAGALALSCGAGAARGAHAHLRGRVRPRRSHRHTVLADLQRIQARLAAIAARQQRANAAGGEPKVARSSTTKPAR